MTAFRLQHPEHEALRQDLLRKYRTSHCQCAQFVRALHERFPALKRVAGFYYAKDSDVSLGEHWWLLSPEGDIIDPTADQFPCCGAGRYVPYDAAMHMVVKGRCMNCGEGLYTRVGSYPCSRACAEDLANEWGCQLPAGPYEDEMDFSCDADITARYGIEFKPPF